MHWVVQEIIFEQNYPILIYCAFRALRVQLLFQLLIVALSVSNEYLLLVYKNKQKMFADFIIFVRAFSKFYKK